MAYTIYHGDSFQLLPEFEPETFHAVVTDPPYGLQFMDRHWDHGVPGAPYWKRVLPVLKPGGHLFAFGGSRTFHRLATAIEDAGFEVRDCLSTYFDIEPRVQAFFYSLNEEQRQAFLDLVQPNAVLSWLYGSGFPKSHNMKDDPWQGFGTALKPGWEPIIVARKPLDGTVANNVLKHGTGVLNIDRCRIPADDKQKFPVGDYGDRGLYGADGERTDDPAPEGRWPANVALDEAAAQALDEQSGERKSGARQAGVRKGMGFHGADGDGGPAIQASSGGASRFFYCAKASKADRGGEYNTHPTVKPLGILRYLVRLVTPPPGHTCVILDPFMGSGSTGVACGEAGVDFVGIEQEEEYAEIAKRRLDT